MEEIIKAVASGLKLDAAKFAADFKNGDDWKTEEEIAEQLGAFISEKVKAANETARKTGRAESAAKLAKLVKNSGFENPDGLVGDALLAAFVEWKDETAGSVGDGDPTKFSKEELLKLPAVRDILKEGERKASEKWANEKKEFEAKISEAQNTRKRLLLDSTLLSTLEKGKVNLGDSPETRALRLELLKSKIDLNRVEIGDNDTLKLLDADGYESDFEKEILPTATAVFGVVTQDKNKGGAGAKGSQGAGGNGQDKYVPTYTFADESDFNKSILNETDPMKRATMFKDRQLQTKEAAGNAG